MSKRPWFPFYTADFLRKTDHLSAEECGCYVRLMRHYWDNNGLLLNNPAQLCRIMGIERRRFKAVWPQLDTFFKHHNSGLGDALLLPRLQEELEKTIAISEVKAEAGRKGGLAKAKAENKHKPTHSHSHSHISIKKENKKDFLSEIDLPDFLNKDTWQTFVQHRKEKRQALKPTSTKLIIKDLTKWHGEGLDTNEILLNSIRNGWTGIFKPGSKKTKSTNGSSVEYVPDDQLAAWAARNGAPGPKHTADYNYDKYRDDLKRWEQSR